MKTKLTIIYFSFYLIFDILVSNFYFNINYKNYGKLHNFYHHTFQENLDININFGPIYYRFCSNIYGFRVHCENKDAIKKKFKYAIIGDSYAEGQNDYNYTFAGMFERRFPSTVNLGVSSYSTIIYFSKIFNLVEHEGFEFDEVILFFDPSDVLQDQKYKLKNNNSVIETKIITEDEISRKKQWARSNFKNILFKNFRLSHYLFVNIRDYLFPKKMIVFNNRSIDWALYDESEYFKNKTIDETLDYSFSFLLKLSDYLKSKNINLSLVIYPHPTELLYSKKESKIVKKFEKFCYLRCHKFINIHDILFDEVYETSVIKTYKKYFIFRDNHLNQKGNEKFAEILFQYYK
jgi:hypothetical protein